MKTVDLFDRYLALKTRQEVISSAKYIECEFGIEHQSGVNTYGVSLEDLAFDNELDKLTANFADF